MTTSVIFAGFTLGFSAVSASLSGSRPNIIYILSDDMGYGDNSYSRPNNKSRIETPNLERMAREGLTFTTGYSGPICAPSRTTLMTGRHMGHTTIRGNDGSYSPLTDKDVTVAAVLKSAGYHTAVMGKWGLGDAGSTGYPLSQGFDEFIGQDSQVGCHDWYPAVIQNNTDAEYKLPSNQHVSPQACGEHLEKCTWSNDLFVNLSIDYIRRRSQESNPFFLYFSSTTPHAGHLAGSNAEWPVPWPYMGKYNNESSWSERNRNFSAAVWAQDIFVGRILDELDALKLSATTVVFFSGDNGPAQDRDFAFDDAAGPFRGFKSSVHEGGIRQQVLVRWPGMIRASSTSRHWFTFWDFLPTAADLAGAKLPEQIDGTSAVPALEGHDQPNKTIVYYEFCWAQASSAWAYGKGWAQAYRKGDWKAIRVNGNTSNMLLYDLANDVGEQTDLASENPAIVQDIAKLMDDAHSDTPAWPVGTDVKPCCANCFKKGGCGGACSGHSVAVTPEYI